MIQMGSCVYIIIVTGVRVCFYVYVFICAVFCFVVADIIITIGISRKSQQLQISKSRYGEWVKQHRLPERDGTGGYYQHKTVGPVSKTSCGHCCWCG